MGYRGSVVVFPIVVDVEAEQAEEPLFQVSFDESKATVAAWSYLSKWFVTAHEDGSVARYAGDTGEFLQREQAHEEGMLITDLQMSADRTYFITACKDKASKVGYSRRREPQERNADIDPDHRLRHPPNPQDLPN